jgi:prevent-host-death family protein
MSFTTLSSREFNQDASKAKRAAQTGSVIITDRGRPAHVLLTFENYKLLTRQPLRIGVLLAERRDPVQGAVLKTWFKHQVMPAFDGRVLPVESDPDFSTPIFLAKKQIDLAKIWQCLLLLPFFLTVNPKSIGGYLASPIGNTT